MYEYLGIYVSELKEYGALIVNSTTSWHNTTVTVWLLDENDEPGRAYYADVKQFTDESGKNVYAAVFPRLPAANYGVSRPNHSDVSKRITVFPGMCEEVRP